MHTYGFEEKVIAKERQCPICGKAFIARSVRRKYCYCEECQNVRYQKKVAKQKLRRKNERENNELLQMPIVQGVASHGRQGSQSAVRDVQARRSDRVDCSHRSSKNPEVVEVRKMNIEKICEHTDNKNPYFPGFFETENNGD